VVVDVAERHEVVGCVFSALDVMDDVVHFKEAVIGLREAFRPAAPSPLTAGAVPSHDLSSNRLADVAVVRLGLLVLRQLVGPGRHGGVSAEARDHWPAVFGAELPRPSLPVPAVVGHVLEFLDGDVDAGVGPQVGQDLPFYAAASVPYLIGEPPASCRILVPPILDED